METTAALENQLLAKGRLGQREVLGRPDMLDLEAAERESGMNGQLLCELEATGRLLALNLLPAVSDLRFPRWQFEQPVLEAIPAILKSFGAGRSWQAYDFLTRPEPLLGGEVPLDVLRVGRQADVLRILDTAASMEQGGH